MAETVIQMTNLTKHFGSVVAVDDLTLAVPEGEVFGFLGPNGAGKTTTIGLALGLIQPTAGRVEIFGQRVTAVDNGVLRRVGALVGAPALLPYLSGADNLGLLARLHGLHPERVAEALELVDMTAAAGRKVKGYSTGMRQRLGLAAALLHDPDLVLLDEPTNGLDPAGMREMRRLIRRLADEGKSVFLSSHLLYEVEQVCDRVAVLNRGRMVAEGPVAALLGQQQPVVRARVPDAEAARATLVGLDGVTAVHGNGAYVEVTGLPAEAVVLHLVQNGQVPSEVTSRQQDLESLFLELTSETSTTA